MTKVCSHEKCGNPVFSKGLCINHWRAKHAKPINKSNPIKPKKVYIRPVSAKQADRLKTYRARRDKYFKEHPVCEFPACNSKNITLHHMKGRTGAFLTDKRYFKSLCQKHHRWVEENPAEAKKMGLSADRLDKHKYDVEQCQEQDLKNIAEKGYSDNSHI